jgi:wyosine [tRNA(Phe)-imidazoG37] synthetase (radical SAM superfamily)
MMALQDLKKLAFGPVPSRRLGKSLGINNIRPKVCSYSCVYCQLGKTSEKTVERQVFYQPCDILKEVRRKVDNATLRDERIDYLTFVSDGEPTLDINIGEEILLLKQMGIPIAVITNASLLWLEDARRKLLKADYVSLKVDAVSEKLWKRVDRPHKDLRLNSVLNGIRDFAEEFKGTIVSETMLVDGVDYATELERIVAFLAELNNLNRAYVAVPTRPPTEKWVEPAREEVVNVAFQVFSEKLGVDRVECLLGYEGNDFAFTGDVVEDLLSIMAIHPMRDDAVKGFLRKANSDWQVIERLLATGELVELDYEENRYYMRKLPSRRDNEK